MVSYLSHGHCESSALLSIVPLSEMGVFKGHALLQTLLCLLISKGQNITNTCAYCLLPSASV